MAIVTVRYWAAAKQAAGVAEETLDRAHAGRSAAAPWQRAARRTRVQARCWPGPRS